MDPFDQVLDALRRANDGEKTEAKDELESLWADLVHAPDALSECVLAHHLADMQSDPREELRWDQLSLAAAERVTDARAEERNLRGGRRGLYPSIHLNLAEDYLKIGDHKAARQSVLAAAEDLDVLPDDAYGQRIRAGYERIAAQLSA